MLSPVLSCGSELQADNISKEAAEIDKRVSFMGSVKEVYVSGRHKKADQGDRLFNDNYRLSKM